MANGVNTLLVGDEIAIGMDPWLRQIPGTLPILLQGLPASRLTDWAGLPLFADAIDQADEQQTKQNKPPIKWNLVIVSLGRREILQPDPKADIGAEVAAVLKTIRNKLPSAKIVWVLPPAIFGEGDARSRIMAALSQAGIRTENMGRFASVSDDNADMDHPNVANIPAEKYEKMAAILNNWIPLGLIQMKGVPDPTKPTGTTADPYSVSTVFDAPIAQMTATPARKWGLVALGIAIVGGGAYYLATERKNA